jgi:S-formylglutathione hydrolase FrmB
VKSFLAAWTLVLLAYGSGRAQVTVRDDSLFASSLGREKLFTVLLPAGYDSARHYPILYLLHGLDGNRSDWLTKSGIARYAARYELVIVFPDAENSWYINAIGDTAARFEDFVMHDLRRYVNGHYGIDTSRQAIAGLSMGGYGAVVLALRFPGTFGFVGSLSGALSVPADSRTRLREGGNAPIAKSLNKAFGVMQGQFYDDHNVLKIFRRTPPDRLPYFYLVSGTSDYYEEFLQGQVAFADSLAACGARFEHHEIQGDHSWTFWDKEVQTLLKRLVKVLAVSTH